MGTRTEREVEKVQRKKEEGMEIGIGAKMRDRMMAMVYEEQTKCKTRKFGCEYDF